MAKLHFDVFEPLSAETKGTMSIKVIQGVENMG
jgi:hypothetical protein